MSRIEADYVEPTPAQFMHKPRCHRAGFNPNARIIPGMPPHSPLNRFRLRVTLATPKPPPSIVNDTD
jgi:hypothetical protein